jgi:hypothetical protein
VKIGLRLTGIYALLSCGVVTRPHNFTPVNGQVVRL